MERILTQHKVLPYCLALFMVSAFAFAATDAELQQAYQIAIKDAEVAEASEIDSNLTPITEETPNLIWRGVGENRQVLVVTWTSWSGYDAMVGKTIRMNRYLQAPVRDAKGNTVMKIYEATRDIWVTVAPEIQEFCQKNFLTPETCTLRMEQLLGVPPANGKTRFVEFWVKPSDLFRPAPDPDITTRSALLDYPVGVSDAHKKWIEDLKAVSYLENGYPWTRLGYTYDWGKTDNHVGLSEYVIRIGALVDVHSSTLNVYYCLYDSSVANWSLFE